MHILNKVGINWYGLKMVVELSDMESGGKWIIIHHSMRVVSTRSLAKVELMDS